MLGHGCCSCLLYISKKIGIKTRQCEKKSFDVLCDMLCCDRMFMCNNNVSCFMAVLVSGSGRNSQKLGHCEGSCQNE